MKRFVIAMALCCVLSSSASAGLIPSVPVAPPPPDEITASTSPGEIPTVNYSGDISDTALNIIQMMVGVMV